MTLEKALYYLDTIPTIGEQVDALEMAIKSLEAWDGLIDKIQSIKAMKEQELLTAGDLTTTYILEGEIGMLEVIITLTTAQLSEVENDK